MHRLIHPVGIVFKGTKFYVTDNEKARSSAVAPKNKGESRRRARPGKAPVSKARNT